MDTASLQIPVSPEERGAIYTKPEVVDFILDLAGYSIDRPLHEFRILEPSFGEGDFLLPITERLLASYRASRHGLLNIVEDLSEAIRAVEVHSESIKSTRTKLIELLRTNEVGESDAHRLADAWIIEGDFLLTDLPHSFTHAVGNPPYVRQELVPDALMAEYRARYNTIYDRADLYIPFIEGCLLSLEPGGALGFICADRWMKNRYGGPLRKMIAQEFHLAVYVDMVDTPAFHSEVMSYPAITIIRREPAGPTRIAYRPQIERESLRKLARVINTKNVAPDSGVNEVVDVTKNSEPWLLHASDQVRVIRRLEADYPLLEETGCKVGIGVATGADKVFIGPLESLNVEPDRKLPLITTKDIETGTVKWKGLGVINPFGDEGQLVDLAAFPLLSSFLETRGELIRKRNVARKNPRNWFRTIDRIYPEIVNRPKLLIPDIKGEAHIVYEEGCYYPHHNLYYVTSKEWDLRALQAVLLSSITKMFISTYSTQMRGGYLRFQAQYLRRIRLPLWKDVPGALRKRLADAAIAGDLEACNQSAFDLYRLNQGERATLAATINGANIEH
ncbi:MAG: Eco57I restriction-modification methylase domain-containing protein [Actinobacteria bacterium]|nr:Eco57I restriction-modification methylase domain-containing protein [Actinomycetota bacterium]MCL5882704.1 Eco57I restriction-modification methylase domain-containing protein [Actinomycetota bacterium]